MSWDRVFNKSESKFGVVEKKLYLTGIEYSIIFGRNLQNEKISASVNPGCFMDADAFKDGKSKIFAGRVNNINNNNNYDYNEDKNHNNGKFDIERFREIDFNDSNNFRIEVDLGKQIVFVYYKDALIKEMVCSGGTASSPTPIGDFFTTQKIYYQWVPKFGVGAYYWIRFYKDYLFHSVPFDEDGKMIEEEYQKLGTPASHGCIRLKLEEAKWLYERLPLGVRVIIS